MRLDRVHVRNFRVLADVRLDDLPERGLVGIIGANESGKTALAEAVAFGFHGRTFGSTPIADLIRWGEDRLEVEIVFTTAAGRFHLRRELDRAGMHLVTLRGPQGAGAHAGFEEVEQALARAGIPAFSELRDLFCVQGGPSANGAAATMLRNVSGEGLLRAAAEALREEVRGREREYSLTAKEIERKQGQQERLRAAMETRDEAAERARKVSERADALAEEAKVAQQAFHDSQKAADAVRRQAGQLRALSPSDQKTLRDALQGLPQAFAREGGRKPPAALEEGIAALRGFLSERDAAVAAGRERLANQTRAIAEHGERAASFEQRIAAHTRRRTIAAIMCLVGVVLAVAAAAGGYFLNERTGAADTLVTTPALAVWGMGAGLFVLSIAAFFTFIAQAAALGTLRGQQTNDAAISAELEVQAEALREALEAGNDLSAWPRVAPCIAPDRTFALPEPWQAVRKLAELVQAELRVREERMAKAEQAHSQAQDALRKARSQKDRAENELREKQAAAEKLEALQEEVVRLERGLKEAQDRIDVHLLGVELLQSTAAGLCVRALPALSRQVRTIFAALTGGKYREFRLGADVTPEVFCGAKGDFLTAGELSGATRLAAGLSVSIAMASLCARIRGNGGHFMFVDCPLEQFDASRREEILCVLKSLDGLPQVFVALKDAPPFPSLAACWRLEDGTAVRCGGADGTTKELEVRVVPQEPSPASSGGADSQRPAVAHRSAGAKWCAARARNARRRARPGPWRRFVRRGGRPRP